MTRWLSTDQQKYWRAWIAAETLLKGRLSRELQDTFSITLEDYEILVRLSESDQRRVRMSDLADKTLSSRSRLSHQIDRMEKNGFVERAACADDGRGQWAILTDQGWDLLVKAAPTHVDGVRTHLLDQLTDEEFAELGKALQKVVDHLENLSDK